MASQSAIGYNNLIKTATITADSYEVNLPPENVQTDHGSSSTGWQTLPGALSPTLTAVLSVSGSVVRCVAVCATNISRTGTVTVSLKLSGAVLWTSTLGSIAPGFSQLVFVANQDYNCDTVIVSISDVYNTDNHINIAQIFAGSLFLPEYSFSNESAHGKRNKVTVNESRGGQEFPTLHWTRRCFKFTLPAVQMDDVWGDVSEINRLSELGGNVLVIPDIYSSNIHKETVFGRLVESSDFSAKQTGITARLWSAEVTQRL